MDHDVSINEIGEQQIVSIRGRFEQQRIPEFIGKAFGELFGRLGLLGVSPAGPPFVIYHQFGPHEVDAEVCVPVSGPVEASGRVQARTIPAMTVARMLHVGPYEELGGAYITLDAWIERGGLEAVGPLQERYLNGPGDNVTPAEYQTEIEIPILATTAAVLV